MNDADRQAQRRTVWASAVAVLVLAGCASYGGRGLDVGESTAADVRRVMGEPATICPLADGGQNMIYPRGPGGLDTYNARVDGGGILRSLHNVLNEDVFETVVNGKTTRQDVLCTFGPPMEEAYFSARKEHVWTYRFRDAWGYPSRFHVLMDDRGIVTGTLQIQEDVHSDDRP